MEFLDRHTASSLAGSLSSRLDSKKNFWNRAPRKPHKIGVLWMENQWGWGHRKVVRHNQFVRNRLSVVTDRCVLLCVDMLFLEELSLTRVQIHLLNIPLQDLTNWQVMTFPMSFYSSFPYPFLFFYLEHTGFYLIYSQYSFTAWFRLVCFSRSPREKRRI